MYQLEWYHARRREYIEKLGGKCTKCWSSDELEFDHIDPETKDFSIGKLMSFSQEAVLTELGKCQLLCKSCHKDKTYPQAVHGTTTMYRHGCRCPSCKESNKVYMRCWRNQRKVGRPVMHLT